MSDLSENKEITNYDETKCPSCNLQYDEEIRIPRILLNCGHTICSQCISLSENAQTPLKCPEDNTEYQNISLISFPINKALIRLLHKISESKYIIPNKQSFNKTSPQNFRIQKKSKRKFLTQNIIIEEFRK